MALFFALQGPLCVAGGNAPTDCMGFPDSSGGQAAEGEGMSSEPRGTARLEEPLWSDIDFVRIGLRLSRKEEKNLPTGTGRDKTEHSLRVILPDTSASS